MSPWVQARRRGGPGSDSGPDRFPSVLFLVNDIDAQGDYRGLCSLHPDAKPLVCALSPLAREVEDPGTGPVAETWSFVPPVEGCPGVGRGSPLSVSAPAHLRFRLDREVADLRRWTKESSRCPDQEAAWELLAVQSVEQ